MVSINSAQFALTQLSDTASSLTSSSARATSPKPVASSSQQDLVDLAQVPSRTQLSPLETGNPAQFQEVLTDTVRRLKEAVLQTSDPVESAYLLRLADQFQRMEENAAAGLSTSAAAAGA